MSNRLLATLLFAGLANTQARAADIENGLVLSAQCVVCHGKLGLTENPIVPKLAGQNELYLLKALTDFRSDKRPTDKSMPILTKKLSEEELADLAAYYASIKVGALPPT